jgi:hypothetical protein
LGKLKCIAFLPSGPQTMNNLLTKLLTAKNWKKTAPSLCSPTDRPLITEVWRKTPLPYIVRALADVALLRSSKRLPWNVFSSFSFWREAGRDPNPWTGTFALAHAPWPGPSIQSKSKRASTG